MQRLGQIKEQPELARECEALFGKEFLARLQRQDRARLAREIETFFEQAGTVRAGHVRRTDLTWLGSPPRILATST